MGKTSTYLSDKVRSVARNHRYTANEPGPGSNRDPILPIHIPRTDTSHSSKSGGVIQDGVAVSPTSAKPAAATGDGRGPRNGDGHVASATHNEAEVAALKSSASPASPTNKSQTEGSGHPSLESATDDSVEKPSTGKRMLAGSKRFCIHVKEAICHSWINVLLIFVPIGIAARAAGLNASIVFGLNAVAIVPLAGLLAHATESVAAQLGNNIGALLNITFGNAVELIIFIIALAKGEISIVQASLLGSILANLLLILGMAFLVGGLRFREQIYNNTVTQMSACLLTLSVASLVLPTAFHASFNASSADDANTKVLEVSRGTSVVLLLVYLMYLLFQLKSHAYMYESTPQHVIDEESHPGVLADMLNSSSSSSSSDSDGDTSSDSSGSNETAGKRLRRMIKNRRRRKSSASTSTVGTLSMPSINSPSIEARENYFEGRSQQTSRRGSPLGVIVSGDEGDADVEDERSSAPRIRDFVSLDGEASKSPERKKKHRRRHRRHHKKRRNQDDEKSRETGKESGAGATHAVHFESPPRAGSLQGVALPQESSVLEQSMTKRPFNMRGISSRATTIRPGLSKMLSNSVFLTPPPQPTPPPPMPQSRSAGNLRRTNSLPDRLNNPNAQPDAADDVKWTTNGTLPPYTVRRVPTRRGRVDSDAPSEHVGENDEKPHMSRTAAVVMLLVTTGLVALCAEFMVDAIPAMMTSSTVSEAFIGLIIIPIVGNAAEHVTAVTVAAKNKMDLAIGVAVGSSIQIALFVTPIIVLLGWIMNAQMSLYFNIFETVSLFVAVLVVNFLCLDGRSNYLEGALLIAAYVIIALVAFFYPETGSQSAFGGGY